MTALSGSSGTRTVLATPTSGTRPAAMVVPPGPRPSSLQRHQRATIGRLLLKPAMAGYGWSGSPGARIIQASGTRQARTGALPGLPIPSLVPTPTGTTRLSSARLAMAPSGLLECHGLGIWVIGTSGTRPATMAAPPGLLISSSPSSRGLIFIRDWLLCPAIRLRWCGTQIGS